MEGRYLNLQDLDILVVMDLESDFIKSIQNDNMQFRKLDDSSQGFDSLALEVNL